MISVQPKDIPILQTGKYMLGAIAPRPIAFVSTISKSGVLNLSPYSFFNSFGTNPPTIVFSPSRRVRDNTVKDTYENIIETGECVVNAVTYSMVEQMNLASCEYDSDVDEFARSGFTPVDSDIVAPKRVGESPFQMECKLFKMINLGDGPGAGNLTICEAVKFHIAEEVVDDDGNIIPDAIDLVGRNGKAVYTRASGSALFEVSKPGRVKGIGFEKMPEYMKKSFVYSANNLGRFGLVDEIPSLDESRKFVESYEPRVCDEHAFERFERLGDCENMLRAALYALEKNDSRFAYRLEKAAKCAIEKDMREFAWKVARFAGEIANK